MTGLIVRQYFTFIAKKIKISITSRRINYLPSCKKESNPLIISQFPFFNTSFRSAYIFLNISSNPAKMNLFMAVAT
jgi:hypothetical protein